MGAMPADTVSVSVSHSSSTDRNSLPTVDKVMAGLGTYPLAGYGIFCAEQSIISCLDVE
jgi:hypothetical protein